MTNANVTRRALTLGARDSTTGWCAKTFTETTIKMLLQPKGSSLMINGLGFYAKYPITGFTPNVIEEGDEVEYPVGSQKYYMVQTAVPIYFVDQFDRYECDMEKRVISNYPATYGTGSTLQDDSRVRSKVFLSTYLTAANLTKDDGATQATYVIAFNGIPYHLTKEFIDNDVDLIFTVAPSTADIQLAFDTVSFKQNLPYAYLEHIPVTIWVCDKSGVTGENLKNKAEQELRRIAATYPNGSGSIHYIKQGKTVQTSILSIYAYEYELSYKRADPTYTSGVSINYGSGLTTAYTIPNVTNCELSPELMDAYQFPPGSIGEVTQPLGAKDYDIILTSDLDIDNESVRWTRATGGSQTTLPADDKVPFQVFLETFFANATSTINITLDLGWGSTLPVRMKKPLVNGNKLTLTFHTYNASSGAGGTYKQWFGLT